MFEKRPSCKAIIMVAASLFTMGTVVHAADHKEAPNTEANPNADIGDYYAWHDGSQLNLILTFGPFAAPGTPASFNSETLYGFHFDTSSPADGIAESSIYAVFAQDTEGNWGVQVTGADAEPVAGPVETVLTSGDVSVWSGLADDPFFFDLTGFNTTIETGTISFNPENDDVAGANITAIAVQLPFASINADGSTLQTWTTTAAAN